MTHLLCYFEVNLNKFVRNEEHAFSANLMTQKALIKLIFRWGTHLYMSLFPSIHQPVCPSVLLHTVSQELYVI